MQSGTQEATIDTGSARAHFATWLRTGRQQRKLSLEDVARITKIQTRILEKLESGQLDGLPAEVFVKGFVRSFAKCVGLDEAEALERLGACAGGPTAKAFVQAMVELAPNSARRLSGVGHNSRNQRGVVVESAPVAPAVVDNAPIAPAVVESAPVASAVVESLPVVPGVVESAPIAPAVVETVAPVIIESALDVATDAGSDLALVDSSVATADGSPSEPAEPQAIIAVDATELPKKKRSRKKSTTAAPRSRKKKSAQIDAVATEIVATTATVTIDAPAVEISASASAVDEDAQTIELTRVTLDSVEPLETGPIAVVTLSGGTHSGTLSGDAESFGAIAIEAKSSDVSDVGNSGELATDGIGFDDGAVATPTLAEGSSRISASSIAVDADTLGASSSSWQPTMPPIAATPSVPWRRPHLTTSTAYVVPTLVIDDADPDSADRERDQRNPKEPQRLSFLPPILLDREDRSARQGGLTLAVIILLIAATLTLSYLMRRPSPSGDGVTMRGSTPSLLASSSSLG